MPENSSQCESGLYSFESLKTSDSIRLFEIFPGKPGEPIRGNIFEHFLQPVWRILREQPDMDEWARRVFAMTLNELERLLNMYDGISYRCGDPNVTE